MMTMRKTKLKKKTLLKQIYTINTFVQQFSMMLRVYVLLCSFLVFVGVVVIIVSCGRVVSFDCLFSHEGAKKKTVEINFGFRPFAHLSFISLFFVSFV